MDGLVMLMEGFQAILSVKTILIMSLGIVVGIAVGTIPGLSSVMAITLVLPVAIGLGPINGLALLGAIYSAAIYGGANSAILLNTPGTPSSLTTAFDGYPLTQQGKANYALNLALLASVFGGLFGTIILIAAFAPLSRLSLLFGPSEFFWLSILGLTSIAAVSPGRLFPGLMAAGIGIWLTTIGQDINTGTLRFTFGIYELVAGVAVVPALLGLFSISQALLLSEQAESSTVAPVRDHAARAAFSTMLKRSWLAIRTSAIGTYIGILPGAGGAIASILAYNHARSTSANPSQFGHGAVDGVIASESANNSQVSSSLIPMMGLGIPGNVNAAVIMGALLSFGIQPGLNMIEASGDIAYSFIASLVVANILMLGIGYLMIHGVSKVLLVPNRILGVNIFVFCVVGAYAASFSLYGVWIAISMGLLGYIMVKFSVPIGPVALGLVLGPMAELGFSQSVQIGKGHGGVLPYMAQQPISLLLMGFIALSIGLALWKNRRPKTSEQSVVQASVSLGELVFYGVTFVGSLLLILVAQRINGSSRFFPVMILFAIAVASALSMLTSWHRISKAGQLKAARISMPVITSFAGLIIYVLLIPVIGFYPMTFVFIASGLLIGLVRENKTMPDWKSLLSTISVALSVVGAIYVIFSIGLGLGFPQPLWGI